MEREVDLAALLSVFDRWGLSYVLIGGMAAVAHGSPFPTEDVDITPATGKDDLARLSSALHELEARVRAEGAPDGLPFAHDADSLANVQTWNLTTRYGDLDLSFVPDGTMGYDDLRRDAEEMLIFGLVTNDPACSTVPARDGCGGCGDAPGGWLGGHRLLAKR